ncbi:MAG: DEAD/DEAH box helicase [Bacteroidota bacterium]|nr:DEAD/DEAH box helicase [Bacteroidota bacterium]
MKFTEFDFLPEVLEGIEAMGFDEATPIQEQAIPVILEENDLIACAQTGTGKTAAYLLPILNKLARYQGNDVNTLIIVPTRELALQIDKQLEGFTYFLPISSIAIYGGNDSGLWEQQKQALQKGAELIIATPGRLISYMNLKLADFSQIKHLILDEADRMLDMGFYDDIQKIVSQIPKERQTLMFSATMPPKIRTLAQSILVNPHEINIAVSKPAEGILQCAYLAYDNQKIPLLRTLLKDKSDLKSILIFTARKSNVDKIVRELRHIGFAADGIHSDLDQKKREEVLLAFRNRKSQMLVATDIISRGIDIDNIDLVINYDVPSDAEDYVHRVGRTARAATTGVAITLINDKDQLQFKRIEDLIESSILKLPVPPELGDSPAYNPESSGKSHKGNFRKFPSRNKRDWKQKP